MSEPSLQCPACGASDVTRGRLGEGRPGTFTPDGLRFWTLTVGMLPLLDRSDPGAAPMSGAGHACTACGLVWTHVDPERLRTVLREAGTAATRARFAANDGESSS
ncbi:MAG: hypothetical protein ACJ79S_06955 [Gemmatimonadaceae bacterium]